MNWDDLRFVLALSRAGSLARAARTLGVDHTTVGRRIEAIESDLGVKLFTRASTGYVATAEAERLWPGIERIEEAVLALERGAHAQRDTVEGTVRITSPETFGACYLAPRLAALGRAHPNLTIELLAAGEVLDLARREADLAVRLFRSRHDNLVVRRAGSLSHGLYASRRYLARRPLNGTDDLGSHPLLTPSPGDNSPEGLWIEKLSKGARPAFVSNLTVALLEAARADAGIAVLPRYLGDVDPSLTHLPMPDPPSEPIWVTVHQDVKDARRVRTVLDFVHAQLALDAALLAGT
jgi:DNA-binding transcriptional LysR family regulator